MYSMEFYPSISDMKFPKKKKMYESLKLGNPDSDQGYCSLSNVRLSFYQ